MIVVSSSIVVVLLVIAIVVLLLATVLVILRGDVTPPPLTSDPAPPPEPDVTAASELEPVTWSPPTGWADYTRVELPPRGDTLELDSDTDYLIVSDQVRTDPVHLRGGRNIVWIGGHIHISDRPACASAESRRALVVSDAPDGTAHEGRLIHLEGLLLDGNDLAEGVNINAPSAVVQLQNIHVGLVRLRGADDRDGSGCYPSSSHPDIVQPWGGKRELRIDGLSGRSNYQGIFLNEDTGVGSAGSNHLRRVDIRMVETTGEDGFRYAGHRGLTWTPEASGPLLLDEGTVWLQHHRNSGWTSHGGFQRAAFRDDSGELVEEPVPGTSTFGDNLHPPVTAPPPLTLQLGVDRHGRFGEWSMEAAVEAAPGRPAVQRLVEREAQRRPGRVYSGRPPGGSYVPAHAVGLHYRSGGYRD